MKFKNLTFTDSLAFSSCMLVVTFLLLIGTLVDIVKPNLLPEYFSDFTILFNLILVLFFSRDNGKKVRNLKNSIAKKR